MAYLLQKYSISSLTKKVTDYIVGDMVEMVVYF